MNMIIPCSLTERAGVSGSSTWLVLIHSNLVLASCFGRAKGDGHSKRLHLDCISLLLLSLTIISTSFTCRQSVLYFLLLKTNFLFHLLLAVNTRCLYLTSTNVYHPGCTVSSPWIYRKMLSLWTSLIYITRASMNIAVQFRLLTQSLLLPMPQS
jgi:hypothetical protein